MIFSKCWHYLFSPSFTFWKSSGYFFSRPSSRIALASSEIENSGVVFFRYHSTAEILGLQIAIDCLLLLAPSTASPKAFRFKLLALESNPLSFRSKDLGLLPLGLGSKVLSLWFQGLSFRLKPSSLRSKPSCFDVLDFTPAIRCLSSSPAPGLIMLSPRLLNLSKSKLQETLEHVLR